MLVAIATERADAAERGVGLGRDPLANGDSRHVRPHRGHDAGELVAEDDWRPHRHRAVGDVDVRAAQRGRLHGQEDLARSRHRAIDILQLESARPGGRLDDRSHRASIYPVSQLTEEPARPRPPPSGERAFDVIVVGAGANGIGIARDAASRGLRVCVIEKDDICSGTSAWNGRLIHGGLRYLEQLDLRLVRESLRERERLFRLAPHLVRPVQLLMPFYRRSRRPPWMIRLGMIAYDALSWDKSLPNHRMLSRTAALARFPAMTSETLDGAARFFEGQVEFPERLCVELAVAAAADGADIRTHARVDEAIVADNAVQGVRYTDGTTGQRQEVRAPVVLNVAGPWVDRVFGAEVGGPPLVGGTKGSHLVVDRFPGAPSDVVYYESQADGRLVLLIPWHDRILIGTTDIRYEDDPTDVTVAEGEVAYLLGETNRLVPSAGLTPASIRYTFSGVRPLPYAPGTAPGALPRRHTIHDHAPRVRGLLSIVGGKLSTFRSLAEDAVDATFRRLDLRVRPCATDRLPLPGAGVRDPVALADQLTAAGIPQRSAQRLVALYGSRAPEVWDMANASPMLRTEIDNAGLLGAELAFAVEHEFARNLTDVLMRRTMIGLAPGHGLASAVRAAEVLGAHLGWDGARQADEVEAYRRYLSRFAVPGRTDPALEDRDRVPRRAGAARQAERQPDHHELAAALLLAGRGQVL